VQTCKIVTNIIKEVITLKDSFFPTYLAHSPNIPPIVTIHCATGQPIAMNTFGIGASGSCIKHYYKCMMETLSN
jgi:hypothetical protein